MAEVDIWCNGNCINPDYDANFHDDGNNKAYEDNDGNTYVCYKHHWSCAICNKIVQVG